MACLEAVIINKKNLNDNYIAILITQDSWTFQYIFIVQETLNMENKHVFPIRQRDKCPQNVYIYFFLYFDDATTRFFTWHITQRSSHIYFIQFLTTLRYPHPASCRRPDRWRFHSYLNYRIITTHACIYIVSNPRVLNASEMGKCL